MKAFTLALLVCLAGASVSGCSTINAADRASRDLFDPIEGMPGWAKAMEKQSLREVYNNGPSGWREYEIGRRLEYGIGVDRDMQCASYWYYRASLSPYEVDDTIHPGHDASGKPYTVKYSDGLPRARNALKRLKGAGTITDAELHGMLAQAVSGDDVCRLKLEKLISEEPSR